MSTVEQYAEFEHETMQRMIDALAKTGRVLRLSDRQPGLVLVATRKIIELANCNDCEAKPPHGGRAQAIAASTPLYRR